MPPSASSVHIFWEYFLDYVAQGEKPPAAFVEGYVKLLQVKSDINANATGVLDSVARLLAAVKNNNVVFNVGEGTSVSGNIDIEKLLSQTKYEDEE